MHKGHNFISGCLLCSVGVKSLTHLAFLINDPCILRVTTSCFPSLCLKYAVQTRFTPALTAHKGGCGLG